MEILTVFSIRKFQPNYLIHKLILTLTLFSKATLKPIRSTLDIVVLLQKKIIVDIIGKVKRLPILPYLQCFPQDVFDFRFKMGC